MNAIIVFFRNNVKIPLIIVLILHLVNIKEIYLSISQDYIQMKCHIIYQHINIAYCSTNDQLANVGYSIISILNRTMSNLHVYLFTPELFEKKNTIFDKLEIEKKGQVKFFMDTINFSFCKEEFRNHWNFWNPFANARLLIPDKLPVSKCIYLDTDVYGCDDINLLWKVNLGDNLIAASLDRFPWGSAIEKPHMKILNWLLGEEEKALMNNTGIDADNYFNSGVLLMNVKEMKKMNFSKKCVDTYKRNRTFFPDQDMLNVVTGHRRIILDWKFNKPVFGKYSKCILRHFNKKKVTHPVVVRHHEDYDYHFEAVDEYYRLMSLSNRTI